MLYITVNGTTLTATLANNSSAEPACLHRTAASMARVKVLSGEKRPPPTPAIRLFSRQLRRHHSRPSGRCPSKAQ